MTQLSILTNEELVHFKQELLSEMKEFRNSLTQQKWLRSKDVRKMLGISDSTLQTLRVNGTIPSYKLGSSWYYKYEEITALLESNRIGGEAVAND